MYMAVPFLLGLLWTWPSGFEDLHIPGREQPASGVVTAYEPNNHDSCRYQFFAGGREWDDIDSCPVHPGVVGSTVTVYFDPRNPARSELENFGERGGRSIRFGSICLGGVFVVFVSILIAKFIRSYRPSDQEPNA
jgi:hypothetical protein